MTNRFKGAGVYDRYTGELMELGSLSELDIEVGEVYEGTREDYNDTFGIEDEIIITKDELINLIDQSDCESEGVLSTYTVKDRETIEHWLHDRWDHIGREY